jgi:hypothetical protein
VQKPPAPRVKIDTKGLKQTVASGADRPAAPRVKIDTKGLKGNPAPTEARPPKIKFDASALRREPPTARAEETDAAEEEGKDPL